MSDYLLCSFATYQQEGLNTKLEFLQPIIVDSIYQFYGSSNLFQLYLKSDSFTRPTKGPSKRGKCYMEQRMCCME